MSTVDEAGDLTPFGVPLPLPTLVVSDGVVIAADDRARRWAPEAGWDSPLVKWFAPADARIVERALDDAGGPDLVARLVGSERWVAIQAGPPGDPRIVQLRDAFDEAHYRAAVDTVADSTFVIEASGANRWRSARLRDRSGMSDAEAARSPAGERIHPEDLPLVFEAFASTQVDHPHVVVARSRAVDDDDRWETIEITVWNRIEHEVLHGYLVQVRNLDEGRTLTTALSEADPQLLSLTEAAPVGILVTDPAGQIVYRNPVARALLGPELQSFGDADWLSLARTEHRGELEAAFSAGLHGESPSAVTAAFGDERPRWLRLRVVPQLNATSDRTKGVIATVEDVTEQVEAQGRLAAIQDQLRHMATHDPLTSLPNRTALRAELDRAVARHARSAEAFAVLFCDLDGFKPVNDRSGHEGGDQVLVEVAHRLRRAVRDGDIVARLGGDEFVVLCESVGDTTDIAERVAQRLHELVEDPITHRGEMFHVGLSIGIAFVPPGVHTDADELLRVSDQAMYDAKVNGPGRTTLRRAG
jgi:diguanylate cyclase (GGDEF)-like protein/PAS domain S-box-containing protein